MEGKEEEATLSSGFSGGFWDGLQQDLGFS